MSSNVPMYTVVETDRRGDILTTIYKNEAGYYYFRVIVADKIIWESINYSSIEEAKSQYILELAYGLYIAKKNEQDYFSLREKCVDSDKEIIALRNEIRMLRQKLEQTGKEIKDAEYLRDAFCSLEQGMYDLKQWMDKHAPEYED